MRLEPQQVRVRLRRPAGAREQVMRDDVAGGADERLQQSELGRGQDERDIADTRLVPGRLQVQVAGATAVRTWPRRPPDRRGA